jgi:hypothetical protein
MFRSRARSGHVVREASVAGFGRDHIRERPATASDNPQIAGRFTADGLTTPDPSLAPAVCC